VDELQQVQRQLQLLIAQVAESEPGSLTGEVGPPLVHVAVEREDQLTALFGVQAVDQTATAAHIAAARSGMVSSTMPPT
jgi:hypothetical protein